MEGGLRLRIEKGWGGGGGRAVVRDSPTLNGWGDTV